jgi:hypothetical protein
MIRASAKENPVDIPMKARSEHILALRTVNAVWFRISMPGGPSGLLVTRMRGDLGLF